MRLCLRGLRPYGMYRTQNAETGTVLQHSLSVLDTGTHERDRFSVRIALLRSG